MAGYRDIQEGAQLRKLVRHFVQKQEITGPECVYQSDRVIENAYELIEKLCKVVGYYQLPPEDENEVP